jgi:murein L,D-transpeptidase YafK
MKKLIQLSIFAISALIILDVSNSFASESNQSSQNYSKPVEYAFMKPNYGFSESDISLDFLQSDLSSAFEEDEKICKAVRLVVDKSSRELSVYYGEQLQKTYKVNLGFNPEGDKIKRNDGKTPEGLYTITYKNLGSQFYKSFAINYPNKDDWKEAAKLGVDPGDNITIHGLANDAGPISKLKHWLGVDWTAGCVALDNSEIDELWEVVDVGTLVEIRP